LIGRPYSLFLVAKVRVNKTGQMEVSGRKLDSLALAAASFRVACECVRNSGQNANLEGEVQASMIERARAKQEEN
jgi:hypothetical protein